MIAVWIFGVYIIFDSYFCAKAFNNNNNQKRQISIVKRIVLNFGIVLFGYVFYLCNPIANYVRVNMVQAFRVTSGSMAPTLIKGDRILTDKSAYKSTEPQRGDIVVFYYPEDTTKIFVDRLIASGMETVEIKEGNVYIDGALVTDPRIKDVNYINRGDYGSGVFDVPKGHYFMLGDNSVSSHDSRYWGSVPKRNIQGKAFKIYYPFNRSGAVE
ncbi:MAG: signal peptidase I [Candidatus Omnitrophica bacterium]|nr:signal peptidase I [Candidatus Omnitrophota bacterium]MBU1996386.1 signal peptidase I [Candidatus Omnitrophota bacterium]MBU4333831.1 signal peptidase I [Candidatus Omnitrophota bacterium]